MKLNMCVKFTREIDLDKEKIFPEQFEVGFRNKKIKFYFENVEGCMYEHDKSVAVYTLKSPALVNEAHYEKKFDKFVRVLKNDGQINIQHIRFEFNGSDVYVDRILAMSFDIKGKNTDITVHIPKYVMDKVYIT